MARDDKNETGNRDDLPLPARKKLPKELQDVVDDEEKLWELMYEGKSEDSTDTSLRYAAYASRIRTIMMSAHRYVAYTSDIGESFRPVAHPWLVRSAYGVSWLYLTGDVAHEGYKAYIRNQHVLHPELSEEKLKAKEDIDNAGNIKGALLRVGEFGKTIGDGVKGAMDGSVGGGKGLVPGHVPAIEDYRSVMAQRAIFQGLASMGLPAFTIHSVVRYSGRALKNAKNKTIRTWAPIGLGLSIVPFLPFIFDEPVEKATEWIFHNAFRAIGGPEAVEGRPVTGNKELRGLESKTGIPQEKEL
ncbi:hypothetical protein P154DRAFT_523803 [Amniculicola lignicola CBS 123094]|uniref:Mitochondrial fission process protein 1 n=1 Tax=Amniculicola lignicola CBS 123094 TaxID=1392246 RepID=A0A6A5WD86_9PLEO|nr:hypothetical protein P154DRAFT_523803 [Amniculicola lignicola CBS 123094]